MKRWFVWALILIVWVSFLGLVTRLDLVDWFFYIYADFPYSIRLLAHLLVGSVLLLILGLVWKYEFSRLKRVALILGIVSLLALPSLSRYPTTALIGDSARLLPGMTKAQVRAIMARHYGGYRSGPIEMVFCAELDPEDGSGCSSIGNTAVHVEMVGGLLVWVSIDLD